jgi:predicted signal transduction protein with EAL and GGDEF domain
MVPSCEWSSVIAAIAIAIPILVAQVVMLVQLAVSKEKQKLMIDQNTSIINEQANVKETLSGSNQIIIDTKQQITDIENEVKEEIVKFKNGH